MNLRHRPGINCPKCEDMILSGTKELQDQWHLLKPQFPDAHMSCVFRSEVWQNSLFKEGKTKKRWPDSKHNKLIGDKPASKAMDLFRLNERGEAEFDYEYYREIAEFFKSEGAPIRWGGDWNGDGKRNELWYDYPHFELADGEQG